MSATRSTRAMVGAACLVAVALVMGWFVGRYLPGQPQSPESDLRSVLADDTGRAASSIVEFAAGSTMELPELLQGEAHEHDPSSFPASAIELFRQEGLWETTLPELEVSVVEARAIPLRSIADWNPSAYASQGLVIDDVKEVLVTLALTNKSDKAYRADWRTIPAMTLWSENLVNGTDALGSGLRMDDGSIWMLNPRPRDAETQEPEPILSIEPGEVQELTLGFVVPRNALVDQSAFDNLKVSGFCIQTADYATGTAYRLWL